jgi:acyl carrier protein
MDEIYQRLTRIFHDLFDDDSIVITPRLTADDVAEWDSLRHIQLILAVQKTFKIRFSAADTANLKNVGELAALIQAKAV